MLVSVDTYRMSFASENFGRTFESEVGYWSEVRTPNNCPTKQRSAIPFKRVGIKIALAHSQFNELQKVAVGELLRVFLADCLMKTGYLQLNVLAFIIPTLYPIFGSETLIVLEK
jgi:hypothetical protein